ncbi:hypothetical protein DFJ73DRAFT_875064 [Zopfochytrium polystomum]|nr:hypothetical protein DFJ73DRAFT_875064 [Zopfochytrium polystomum]
MLGPNCFCLLLGHLLWVSVIDLTARLVGGDAVMGLCGTVWELVKASPVVTKLLTLTSATATGSSTAKPLQPLCEPLPLPLPSHPSRFVAFTS